MWDIQQNNPGVHISFLGECGIHRQVKTSWVQKYNISQACTNVINVPEMCRIFGKTISALANYDSNWHLTTTGKIFQTDGDVTMQKYYINQLSYGAYFTTFDNVALLINLQNTHAMAISSAEKKACK